MKPSVNEQFQQEMLKIANELNAICEAMDSGVPDEQRDDESWNETNSIPLGSRVAALKARDEISRYSSSESSDAQDSDFDPNDEDESELEPVRVWSDEPLVSRFAALAAKRKIARCKDDVNVEDCDSHTFSDANIEYSKPRKQLAQLRPAQKKHRLRAIYSQQESGSKPERQSIKRKHGEDRDSEQIKRRHGHADITQQLPSFFPDQSVCDRLHSVNDSSVSNDAIVSSADLRKPIDAYQLRLPDVPISDSIDNLPSPSTHVGRLEPEAQMPLAYNLPIAQNHTAFINSGYYPAPAQNQMPIHPAVPVRPASVMRYSTLTHAASMIYYYRPIAAPACVPQRSYVTPSVYSLYSTTAMLFGGYNGMFRPASAHNVMQSSYIVERSSREQAQHHNATISTLSTLRRGTPAFFAPRSQRQVHQYSELPHILPPGQNVR
jgi:hypothetical protein